jgi:hypothetical protein
MVFKILGLNVRVINSRRMRWKGHEARIEKRDMNTKF